MEDPIFKEEFQVGFYFFWKWQYQQRNNYLSFIKGMEANEILDVDNYLKNIDTSKRYTKTSSEIIKDYFDKAITLENLLTKVPRSFRRGYHLVDFKYKNKVLTSTIDTSRIDVDRNKKGILDEINGVLQMIIDEQKGIGIVPEKPQSIGHEKYWRKAASNDLINLKVNFLVRATGLWLWDRTKNQKCSEKDINDMFDIFPNLDADDTDSSHWYSKFRKRLALTHKCIQEVEVLSI